MLWYHFNGRNDLAENPSEYEIARNELNMIEQLLTHFYSRQFALDAVRALVNVSHIKGDYSDIHEALHRHRDSLKRLFAWT